jgi:hypothetical protein
MAHMHRRALPPAPTPRGTRTFSSANEDTSNVAMNNKTTSARSPPSNSPNMGCMCAARADPRLLAAAGNQFCYLCLDPPLTAAANLRCVCTRASRTLTMTIMSTILARQTKRKQASPKAPHAAQPHTWLPSHFRWCDIVTLRALCYMILCMAARQHTQRTRAHKHSHTHARARAHTRTHTHTRTRAHTHKDAGKSGHTNIRT